MNQNNESIYFVNEPIECLLQANIHIDIARTSNQCRHYQYLDPTSVCESPHNQVKRQSHVAHFYEKQTLYEQKVAPVCPIGKITLWVGCLYLTSQSEASGGLPDDKGSPEPKIEPQIPDPKSNMPSTKSPLDPFIVADRF